MIKPITKTTLMLVLLATISCGPADKENTGDDHNTSDRNEQVSPESNPGSQSYQAEGTVVSIPPGKRNIIVKHGDIPGFMNAMTMPFLLKDSSEVSGIAPEDSIHFTIVVNDGQVSITEIEKVHVE